jgi:hypothetical protein
MLLERRLDHYISIQGSKGERIVEEKIPVIGSECKGSRVIRSKVKCMGFNLCEPRRIELPKSRSIEVIWDHPSSRETGGARSTTLEVCGQGRSEIDEEDPDRRSRGNTCQ